MRQKNINGLISEMSNNFFLSAKKRKNLTGLSGRLKRRNMAMVFISVISLIRSTSSPVLLWSYQNEQFTVVELFICAVTLALELCSFSRCYLNTILIVIIQILMFTDTNSLIKVAFSQWRTKVPKISCAIVCFINLI